MRRGGGDEVNSSASSKVLGLILPTAAATTAEVVASVAGSPAAPPPTMLVCRSHVWNGVPMVGVVGVSQNALSCAVVRGADRSIWRGRRVDCGV